METSVFIAWMIGPFLVVTGLAVLINRKYYRDMAERFFNDPQDYFFSGAVSFLVGMAIIITHNRWVADWTVIITLFGWLSLAKGVLRLTWPQGGRAFFNSTMKPLNYLAVSGAVMIALGLFLIWQAWSAG